MPRSYRGAASSRAETNWLDDDASMVTTPPSTAADARRCANGQARSRRRRSRRRGCAGRRGSASIGRSRARGSPSKSIRPSASAATGGTKRITVPASPQSIVGRAAQRARARRSTVVRRRRRSWCRDPASACTISRVSRASSGRVRRRRAVGERGEEEGAVGDRLRAREASRSPRPAPDTDGAGHGAVGGVVAVTVTLSKPTGGAGAQPWVTDRRGDRDRDGGRDGYGSDDAERADQAADDLLRDPVGETDLEAVLVDRREDQQQRKGRARRTRARGC